MQVLVVGGGPTGLALACELARHGVRCRVVERAPGPTDRSKALAVHSRTLELLDDMGIVDRALAAGKRVGRLEVHAEGERLATVQLAETDTPYPFVLALPQSETERILERRAVELGVTISRSAEVVAFADQGDGVLAEVRHADGREEAVRSDWLVGCDGAHSTVRKALALPFAGVPYEEPFALADVRVDWPLEEGALHAFLAHDGVLGAIPMPGERRYRLVAALGTEAPDRELTLADVERYMEGRGPAGARVSDPHWISTFRIQRRIVPRYRVGRALLAGDAAHIHSPVGGQGMNTGIQDAYNLGWKLALVVRGRAPESLIDSYEAERRPVAADTLRDTELATRFVTLRNPIARKMRNALASLLTGIESIQHRIVRATSELALDYRGSPIVAEHGAWPQIGGGPGHEAPGLGDWRRFRAAPRAGQRAPDGPCRLTDGRPARLLDVFRGTRHVLLLFDGREPTGAGYERFRATAAAVAGTDLVRAYLVTASDPPEAAWLGARIVDEGGALHELYGAGSESVYLVRPDGYVGFRCQPADPGRFADHLRSVLA